MAWPTSTTVIAGANVTAAERNAIRADVLALNGFVRKATLQTVSASTTLVNDSVLVLPITVAGTYVIEAIIPASSSINAGGDIKIGASWPTATSVDQFGIGADPGLASGSVQTGEWKNNLLASSGSSVISYGLSTTNVTIYNRWCCVFTGTGNFQVMWAQVSASGTSSVLAGAHLQMRQVA